MGHSVFGWSYPPGCSGPPEPPEPSELVDTIWKLLEEAGLPEETNAQIAKLIEVWEAKKEADLNRAWEDEMARFYENHCTGCDGPLSGQCPDGSLICPHCGTRRAPESQ